MLSGNGDDILTLGMLGKMPLSICPFTPHYSSSSCPCLILLPYTSWCSQRKNQDIKMEDQCEACWLLRGPSTWTEERSRDSKGELLISWSAFNVLKDRLLLMLHLKWDQRHGIQIGEGGIRWLVTLKNIRDSESFLSQYFPKGSYHLRLQRRSG